MVFVTEIEDAHALIVDGPVVYEGNPTDITASRDLSIVQSAPEFRLLAQKERERPALQRNADDALDRVARYLAPSASPPEILDVGSGFGFFLASAQARGWRTHGLEPLSASAVYARATFGLDILCDVLHDSSFEAESFDVVTSFQVFEHLPFPREDLLRLHRFVRPGGVILIEVPNIDTMLVRILKERHRHFVQDHLNFFSRKTLSRILEETGFAPLSSYYPWRRMTIGHFVDAWNNKLMPAPIARPIAWSADRLKVDDAIVAVNVRDIVAVIARRC